MILDVKDTQDSETQKEVKKNKTNYFDVREEEAVKRYITAESYEEKEEIYNKFLKADWTADIGMTTEAVG